MFIAMNRFRIDPRHAEIFETTWRERESHLSEQPGFVRFQLLKSRMPADAALEFISYSQWIDQESFLGWMEGEGARRAHGGASKIPREAYLGPPEFRGYGVLLDQVGGHRTDYRSTHMDIKVEERFAHESDAQKQLAAASQEAGLPPISIGAFEGRILEILLRSIGARTGIEIGTLGGYSSSWIARALPKDGQLISIEKEPARAEIARRNLERAGVSQVEIRVGTALEVLEKGPWPEKLDFVFIDADKGNSGAYVEWAIPRLRKGGLIIVDNSYIWGGMNYFGRSPEQLPTSDARNEMFQYSANEFRGMSSAWSQLADHPEFASIVLPTGEGLAIGVKTG